MAEQPTDSLQAGRELDRLIAQRFELPEYSDGQEFGTGGGLPIRYSRDTAAGMELLKMADVYSINCDKAYQEAYTVKVRVQNRNGEGRAGQLPLAICRAILQAVGVEE